jgi:MFS family permease
MNSSTVVQTYIARVRAFHPNARLYLVSALLTGAALGVYRLLFNFYMLSLGYDERLLGQLITTTSMTALLVALPMGYLSDMIGRKWSLILGGASVVAAILTMVLLPSIPMFFAMNMLMGAGQSLSAVTMSPFLMENSGIQERTYLFSLSVGLQTAAGAVGNWVGGRGTGCFPDQ